MNLQTLSPAEVTITSLEFSELTWRQHSNILNQVRNLEKDLFELWEIKNFSKIFSLNKAKWEAWRKKEYFILTKKYCDLLAMWMDRKIQIKVYNRMRELEKQLESPLKRLPQNLTEAYLELARIETEKLKLKENEVKFLENDRKQYWSIWWNKRRKEKYKRERDDLKIELDKSTEYATVRKMSSLTWKNYWWKDLRNFSNENDIKIKKIPDWLYWEVNAYHKIAWNNVYWEEI